MSLQNLRIGTLITGQEAVVKASTLMKPEGSWIDPISLTGGNLILDLGLQDLDDATAWTSHRTCQSQKKQALSFAEQQART